MKAVKPGAVIADVAIDQCGCAETSRPTTHSYPTYLVDISTIGMITEVMTDDETESWSRLSEQFFRFDKWSLCRG